MRRTACFCVLTGLTGVSGFAMRPSPRLETSVAAVGHDAEIMTGLLVAGLAVATYQEYRTDKFEAIKEFTKPHREQLVEGIEELQAQVGTLAEEAAAATVAEEESDTPTTEPMAAVVEGVKKVEEPVAVATVPSPAPVVGEAPPASVPAPVATPVSAPAPAPAPEVVLERQPVVVTMERSKPSPTKATTDRNASDDLTELVKKVGKTVEQNKQMEDLVKARREKEAATETTEKVVEPESTVTVLTKEKPKKRSIIRKAWRVTKKVVAPWRKWENIS